MPRRGQYGDGGGGGRRGMGRGREMLIHHQHNIDLFARDILSASNVAQRLHELRSERELSIRALADMSNLSVNTLSLIENGKTSPSVGTLQQLADAMQVPITAFFEVSAERKRVIFCKETQRPKITVEETDLEDLSSGISRSGIQPLVVTLKPTASSGTSSIVHTGHEFVYCLEGRVLYTIENQSYVLEPGDSLLFEANLLHRWENLDETPSKIILILFQTDKTDTAAERHFGLY